MTAGYIEALECLADRTVVQGWATDAALRSGALTFSFDGIAQRIATILPRSVRARFASACRYRYIPARM